MSTAHAAMFQPATYVRVRPPAGYAETLPPWCYTSEDFYRAEVDRIFMDSWNFLGRAERAANPGDYFTVDLVGVPVLIVRGEDGCLRAFANTCRHRGTCVAKGEGNTRALVCPYHGWTYFLDGRLRGARGLEGMQDFEPARYGLHQFRLETWGGFIFVNFHSDTEPLSHWLGDLPAQMESYDCDNFLLTRRVEFDVACNWKSHIENSVEDYHVPSVHSNTLQQIQGGYEHSYPETTGNWLVMRERHSGTRALLVEDLAHALPRIPTLTGHAAEGTNFVCLFPCTLLAFTTDSMWYIELYPQGPHRTKLAVGMCFPRETTKRQDFEESSGYYYKRWVTALGEDNDITEQQLRGLRSPFAKVGRVSPLEALIPKMGRWWLDRILRPLPKTNACP